MNRVGLGKKAMMCGLGLWLFDMAMPLAMSAFGGIWMMLKYIHVVEGTFMLVSQ